MKKNKLRRKEKERKEELKQKRKKIRKIKEKENKKKFKLLNNFTNNQIIKHSHNLVSPPFSFSLLLVCNSMKIYI